MPRMTAKQADFRVREARPRLLLSGAIVVWLSLVLTPCTAFAGQRLADQFPTAQAAPTHCQGEHQAAGPEASECCCERLVITNGETPKVQKVTVFLAISVPCVPLPEISNLRSAGPQHGPPPMDGSPPIYLSTQRLRI